NRVYRVDIVGGGSSDEGPEADRNAAPERLVAKFYRPGRWSDDAILEDHRFTQQLADAELPVIPPLADEAGRTLFFHGGHRFALYPCRGGRPPELDDPDHLEQLGRLIARIHAIGATEPFKFRTVFDIESMGEEPRAYLMQCDLVPDYLRQNYGVLTAELLEQVRAQFARCSGVAQIRLHGDLHPGNVLWTEAGPHLVDFDDARTGPAIQDLWMFLSGDRAYMTARLADLLAGYCEFCDFDPLELHLIEALRTLRMIHHVAWIARRWSDPAFPRAFPGFLEPRFWEDHIHNLREQVELLQQPVLVWD
ncbi:MAG: serine/threonine protein kinase, partial [Gammaproteobacteria bacterium]|nr:serine/threonine protein kinase [Gammaproteobacteria bacterium]